MLNTTDIRYFVTGGVIAVATVNYPLNEWFHLAVTHDTGGDVNLYFNGKLVDTASGGLGTLPGGFNGIIGAEDQSLSNRFSGLIDELVIWSTELTAAEVFLVYSRQFPKYSGAYSSPILNFGISESWTNLDWVTSLPFGKELPGSSGNELSTDYASLVDSTGTSGDSDLNNNLVGLWNLNEATLATAPGGNDFIDSSSSSNHGTAFNTPNIGVYGKFSNSVNFNSGNQSISIPDNPTLDITNAISVSAWIYPTEDHGNNKRIVEKSNATWGLRTKTGTNGISAWINGGHRAFTTDNIFKINEWTHVVFTYDKDLGGNEEVRIYINGTESATGDFSTAIATDGSDLLIAKYSANTSNSFRGSIDEIAIWSRSLNAAEVLELYRRGANRVKYQVRSCDDSACDSETWIGPDGTASSYFSELHNCSSINGATGECNGDVNTESPSLDFSDFVSTPADNQYFQYRVILESDDETGVCAGSTTCMPSVSRVEVGPTGRYYGVSASIRNMTPVSYSALKSFSESKTGGCTTKYQLSRDGNEFFYWDVASSDWKTATDNPAETSDADTINSNLSSFIAGSLYWRSYFVSNPEQSCSLSSLDFTYEP